MNERKPKPLTVRQQELLLDQLDGPMQQAFQKIEHAERVKIYQEVGKKVVSAKFTRRHGTAVMSIIQTVCFSDAASDNNARSMYGFPTDAIAMALYLKGGTNDYNKALKKAQQLNKELMKMYESALVAQHGGNRRAVYQRMQEHRNKLKLKLAFVGSNMDVDAFLDSARKELDALVKVAEGSE